YRWPGSPPAASATSSPRCVPWGTRSPACSAPSPTVTSGSARDVTSGRTQTKGKPMINRTPVVTTLRVVPVAGHDGMLLTLSGAHGPYFTRNLLILRDSDGRTGVGEVPGGAAIQRTLEEARRLVEGRSIGDHHAVLADIRTAFGDRDAGGRGAQTFDLRV